MTKYIILCGAAVVFCLIALTWAIILKIKEWHGERNFRPNVELK
jgi:hypothetical protein